MFCELLCQGTHFNGSCKLITLLGGLFMPFCGIEITFELGFLSLFIFGGLGRALRHAVY